MSWLAKARERRERKRLIARQRSEFLKLGKELRALLSAHDPSTDNGWFRGYEPEVFIRTCPDLFITKEKSYSESIAGINVDRQLDGRPALNVTENPLLYWVAKIDKINHLNLTTDDWEILIKQYEGFVRKLRSKHRNRFHAQHQLQRTERKLNYENEGLEGLKNT